MSDQNMQLSYQQPAQEWTEALPLGNGRLGAMVFGGVQSERVALNDDTLWSGEPGQNDVYKNLYSDGVYDQVENLLAERKYVEAHALIQENWMGRVVNCYQPLGDLLIQFNHQAEFSNYQRSLDLNTAICKVSYQVDIIEFQREYFTSFPDKVFAIHLNASEQGCLSFDLELTTKHPYEVVLEGNQILLKSKLPGLAIRYPLEQLEYFKGNRHGNYPELFESNGDLRADAKQVKYCAEVDEKGMRFAAALELRISGGSVIAENGKLSVLNADHAEIYLSTGSSYNGFDRSPSKDGKDEIQEARQGLSFIEDKNWLAIKNNAVQDYQSLFQRMSFNLGVEKEKVQIPTDQRIRNFDGENDLGLIALLFQYGRYLMICGSREGTQALNLQGIWNQEILPPWASNYTLNINTEMNYWPAETCNLSDCVGPLIEMIRELSIKGNQVAKHSFNLDGWTANHNSTIWRIANPVEGDPRHSFWPLAGGWLCSHLWEHYQFTGDIDFLRETAFPLMEGAADFLNGWLVKLPDGNWATPVGTSPENQFQYQDDDGCIVNAAMSPGPTMDMAIIRELFANLMQAAQILSIEDSKILKEIREKQDDLLPYQVGKYGQLQEWIEDFEESEPHHRHTSHLYGVFPGNQIGSEQPELSKAVCVTLERRGDESTGWAKGWRICLWARLGDGNHAHKMISSLLTLVGKAGEPNYQGGGGVYANLFDAHPPFQIDGNFGATAGIAEMLLQSQNKVLHLLPALPDIWTEGEVRGLKARGGFEVDICWKDGNLLETKIKGKPNQTCQVRYKDAVINIELGGDGQRILTGLNF